MSQSIFLNKEVTPDKKALKNALDSTYELWNEIRDFVFASYPAAIEEWNFSSAKYGWSFRIKDKKRAIIYLLPRDKYFKTAFVFGEKATNIILSGDINKDIKTELQNARVYAEGRGIRIDVKDSSVVKDIKGLVQIKISA